MGPRGAAPSAARPSGAARDREPSDWDFTRVEQEIFLRCDAEIHFLLIAARNLLRALEHLQRLDDVPGIVGPELRADIIRLRDCFEHWDEHEAAFKSMGGNRGRAH